MSVRTDKDESKASSAEIAPLPAPDPIIAKVEKARLLLAEARDATDAKKIMDFARAAEVYAKRQKLSEEAIATATAIRVDAMTLMGEFLKNAEKRGPEHSRGGGSKGSQREPLPDAPPTLAEIGITKKESAQSQALAEVKRTEPEVFEKARNGKITVSKAVAALKPVAMTQARIAAVQSDPTPDQLREILSAAELLCNRVSKTVASGTRVAGIFEAELKNRGFKIEESQDVIPGVSRDEPPARIVRKTSIPALDAFVSAITAAVHSATAHGGGSC
jgi:hypothetical protein